MVGISVDRELGSETFEYGEHEIEVTVSLKYTAIYSHQNLLNYNLTLRSSPEEHYVRLVEVWAYRDDDVELRNESHVVLDAEEEVPRLFGSTKVRNKVVNVREHIAETVRPVFEELDELYQYTTEGESIDIDVATHEVKAETSWVAVEDEIDRLSREIEGLTGRQRTDDY